MIIMAQYTANIASEAIISASDKAYGSLVDNRIRSRSPTETVPRTSIDTAAQRLLNPLLLSSFISKARRTQVHLV